MRVLLSLFLLAGCGSTVATHTDPAGTSPAAVTASAAPVTAKAPTGSAKVADIVAAIAAAQTCKSIQAQDPKFQALLAADYTESVAAGGNTFYYEKGYTQTNEHYYDGTDYVHFGVRVTAQLVMSVGYQVNDKPGIDHTAPSCP